MGSRVISYYENYTPAADVVVIALCFVFLILIWRAYINRTRSFILLQSMIYMLFVAAVTDILFHMSMNYIGVIPRFFQYLPRVVYHMSLFTIMWLYLLYARVSLHLETKTEKRFLMAGFIGYFVILSYEILGTILKKGFYIDDEGVVHSGIPIFPIGYIFYVVLLVLMVIIHKERVYRQVVRGVVETAVVAFVRVEFYSPTNGLDG